MLKFRVPAIILIVCIIFSGFVLADSLVPVLNTSSEQDDQIQGDGLILHGVPEEPESYYDIFFVSSDQLQQIMAHPGPDALVLKTDPGKQIGIITPDALYLRSDLSESDIPVTDSSVITMDDVSRHFIDITFGRDNQKIVRFKSDRDYKFFFTDEYSDTDIRTVLDFATFFNDISNIVSIEDEECELSFLPGVYETPPYYYYNISIVSPLMFTEYIDNKNSTDQIFRSNTGKTIGIVTAERLVLTNDLNPEERPYYILRGILWSMGFHGETTRYQDSFFTKGVMNKNLSSIDIQALTLMYGGRLQSGLDLETTRKVLNLIQNQKDQTIG